jgi:hypothetical protein
MIVEIQGVFQRPTLAKNGGSKPSRAIE